MCLTPVPPVSNGTQDVKIDASCDPWHGVGGDKGQPTHAHPGGLGGHVYVKVIASRAWILRGWPRSSKLELVPSLTCEGFPLSQ